MSKLFERNDSDMPDQSDMDAASQLTKMQRQLLYLERKIDSLIDLLQEKQPRGNSPAGKPFRKRPFSKGPSSSGYVRRHDSKEQREASEERGSDQAFYSKFRKTGGRPGSGPRKRPSYHKQKERK